MLITGNNRQVFDVPKLVKLYPDVAKYIVSCRRMLKCRVMSDRCPILQAKSCVEKEGSDINESVLSQLAVSHAAGRVEDQPPRSGIIVKRRRRSVCKSTLKRAQVDS